MNKVLHSDYHYKLNHFIKFYLGNKSNFERDLNIKVSGYENDSSNTPLVSDGKDLTVRNYGFIEKQGLVIFLDALGMKGI